jgi:pimeloyl-ACP methyl ester carboxylesterase
MYVNIYHALNQQGFPETAHVTWSLQIIHFADLGYQVVAPDQRGYNQSSKPAAIADYDIDLLTADIVALIKQYSPNKKVYVVGHDWGAFITWTIAQQYPELLEKIFIMNVPHFAALQDAMYDLTTLQLFKSYYIFYFQLPYLPELRMLDDNSSKFYQVGNMKYAAQKGNIGLPFLNTLRSSWLESGAPTGIINWYRALIRKTIFGNVKPLMAPIHVPTYILWGYNDYYLHEVTARKSMDYLAAEVKNQSKLVYLYDVEHFLIHQVPDTVNEHIREWILR